MVRSQNGSARPGGTPRSAVKPKPGVSARPSLPPSSRTPPLLSSPRLVPASGGRLIASDPVTTKSSADPLTAYPRSGNLYDSPGAFLSRTSAQTPVAPATRQSASGGGDYVVFSNSGNHMTRRRAGQGEASDSVAALLQGGSGGANNMLLGTRRLSLGSGAAVDRSDGVSSALTRLPVGASGGAGKTSARPVHPASGPPTTLTRQNLLLSRKGRRSQEHLAPLRREDLSLDPRKDTLRYGVNNNNGATGASVNPANAWSERPGGASPAARQQHQQQQQQAQQYGQEHGDGMGTGDDYTSSPGSAAGNRTQPLFSSLRYYTSQRLAQDQQNAAEYETGVLGGDGSRAFALSGGVGAPSSTAAATAARSRRLSLGSSNNNNNNGNANPLSGTTTGAFNPFVTTNRLNYTGGLATSASPAHPAGSRGGASGAGASPSAAGNERDAQKAAALAAHMALMPRELVHFGQASPDHAYDGAGEEEGDDLMGAAAGGGDGGGMYHTIHPGDDTDHYFVPDGDEDDDYFEDPATELQLMQQAFAREAAAEAVDSSNGGSPSPAGAKGAGKGKKKDHGASPGKGKKKNNDGGGHNTNGNAVAQPYDFRVVLSSGKTVVNAVQLTVGSGCVQGLRPTMEDEHVAKLHLATVKEQSVSVVAILDGHCGRRVAELGAKYLPDYVCKHEALGENTALAIVESIVQADQSIYKVCCGPPSPQQKNARSKLMSTQRQDFARSLGGGGGMSHDESGGSTLIAAVVLGRMLYVACLGDARAVLYDGRTTIAMSEDHKPNNAKEMKRINQCGGFVQFGRVCGVLAVSRALGDYEFKEQAGTAGTGRGGGVGKLQFRTDKELMVSNIADVRQIQLTDESKFLLLACDGLWDVISNEQATQFIRDFLLFTPEISDPQILSGQKPRPAPAVVERMLNNCCRKLAEFAVSSGSTDNVSVTVLFFHDVVDVVASFGAGANATAGTGSSASSARRGSLFSQSRSPQSGRQQQQQDMIDSVLFGASRGGAGRSGSTTLMNGRPVRGGSSNSSARGAAPSSGLDGYFGSSFGRKSASRGIENTFGSAGSGSRAPW